MKKKDYGSIHDVTEFNGAIKTTLEKLKDSSRVQYRFFVRAEKMSLAEHLCGTNMFEWR